MEKLKVILKDGTDISNECKENGTDILAPYNETLENPTEYFKGLSINGTVYEDIVVVRVFLEKDNYYFCIIYRWIYVCEGRIR